MCNRMMRRQSRMLQHWIESSRRRAQQARMRAVQRRVMLPNRGHPHLLDFGLLQPLRLGASILKPNFHLWKKLVVVYLYLLYIITVLLYLENCFKAHKKKLNRRQQQCVSHLGLGQVQRRREFGPLGNAQVLPFAEFLLQRQQLLRGEWRPWLAIWLVLPQVALNLRWFAVFYKQKN